MSPNARTLVVAPYVGEFGWELMNWQGRVRWLVARGGYRHAIICAPADRRALYAQPNAQARVDFCPLANLDVPGEPNDDHRLDADGKPFRVRPNTHVAPPSRRCRHRRDACATGLLGRTLGPARLRAIVESIAYKACEGHGFDTREAVLFAPDYRSTIWPTTPAHQLFHDLREPRDVSTDVVIIPRLRSLAHERNQPASWWEELTGRLRDTGLRVERYKPSLNEAVDQLSSTRLAIGASTGGLHLASLCRCPHSVWGSGPDVRWTRLGITNRQRYETIWNPLGTPCRYDACGWRPSIERVVDQTRRALDEIGLASGQARRSWAFKPKWRIKRRLARLLESDEKSGICPWRVRRLVREYMV